MSQKKIAINGFGRIGRAAFKIALEHQDELEVVAINDLVDTETLAYLLQYDTVYGKYDKEVTHAENTLIVDGQKYKVFAEKEPQNLPWKDLGVETVIESTGLFCTEEKMKLHVQAGAKNVMLSAPAKEGDVATHIMGVSEIEGEAVCHSNASCTTNSVAPPVKVLHDALTVKKAILSTIHAYTADQNLIDAPHKDLRRGRSAAENIVPTSTGAAQATAEVIPDLKNKFDGIALRVPIPIGSLSDITMVVGKPTTVEEINTLLTDAAATERYKGILGVTNNPIVSSDIIGTTFSGIVDLSLTTVVDGDLVKILVWYDNEWAYSVRLIEAVIKC